MPPGFEFPTATKVEVWTPLAFNPKDIHGPMRRARMSTVIGRIAPGATMQQAQEEITVIAGRIATEYKDSNDRWTARVVPAREQLVSASRPALMVLMGAVGFLLLIVCANMANLLLARLSSRRREIAVRAALGATRWEVAQPIVAESLILSFTGGVLGVVGAFGLLRLIAQLPESRMPRLDAISIDEDALVVAFNVAVGGAVAVGMKPAQDAVAGEP